MIFCSSVDQVYKILIYKKSNNEWKAMEILTPTDDCDI